MCNAVLNLRHVHFLFDATLNILKKRSRQATHVFPGRLTTKFLIHVETWILYRGNDHGVSKVVLDAYENYGEMEFNTRNSTTDIDDGDRHIKLIAFAGKEDTNVSNVSYYVQWFL